MTMLYNAGKGLARFCFNVFGRLEVTGREGVPPFGPLIVVSNHLSNSDPPVLVASISRPLNFLGKKELFANPLFGWTLRQWNVHPIDRTGTGIDALKVALSLLARDRAVVIFPEGHRSPDHTMKQGMAGAAYIAIKSQAVILPVGITGTEKVPGWFRMPFPFARYRVNIGQPFTLPVIEGVPSRAVVTSMCDLIMRRIADLLPEEYRGVYATPKENAPKTVAPHP